MSTALQDMPAVVVVHRHRPKVKRSVKRCNCPWPHWRAACTAKGCVWGELHDTHDEAVDAATEHARTGR